MERCGRCGQEILTAEDREACAVCGGPLCWSCWEEHGEGVHSPADLRARPVPRCGGH